MPHVPVLLHEVLEYLDPRPGSFVVDGTADGGGHAEAILKKLTPTGQLLALDWDKQVLEECKKYLGHPKNVLFVHANYAEIASIITKKKLPKVDSLLLDLGFSSLQMDQSGRGFSFKEECGEEPLLMTYDDKTEPVRAVLRKLREEELARIIYEFGGERFARRVARVIKEELRKRSIETSGELATIVRKALPRHYERGRIDPATRTFQALRIYANQELENLTKILLDLPQIMSSGGRAALITFHSLEDRIVKQSFKKLEKEQDFKIITKKPIAPSRTEIIHNPRSRSAKLRVIEKN